MISSNTAVVKSKPSINVLIQLFFWWLKPFFCRKNNDTLRIQDFYEVSIENNSEHLGNKLERHWLEELNGSHLNNRKPSLFNASWKTFGWLFLYYGIHVFIICVILRGFQPYVLGHVVEHFDARTKSTASEFYFYAIALIMMVLSQAVLGHHSVVGRKVVGMRISIAYASLIYRKILRLSVYASNEYNAGKIVNLLSNDLNKFEDLCIFLHYIWILPIQGVLMAYFIWDNVGVAALSGIFFLVLQTLPIQGYLAKATVKLRAKVANKTDERVRLISEIVNGIHVIKMYTWEKPFEDLVSLARRCEVNAIAKKSYLRGVSAATSAFAESTSLFFVIATYVLFGNPLQASIVYSVAQYFNMIKTMITVFYPRAISSAAEVHVTLKRVEEFLLLDEIPMKNLSKTTGNDDVCGIAMTDVVVSLKKESKGNALIESTLNISDKKLYIVTGHVGSGKSTLLKLFLGELTPTNGNVNINGTISYACQESWLFPSTVRDNITFGEPFDDIRYERVVDACALKDDFGLLPNGDLTVLGDRGCTLSGGQCARINLARSVYRNVDIYLIDDALAAVDAHVGQHLFDKCINGLLKDKIVVLVTHNSKYFEKADEIIFMNNGQIKFQGSWIDFKNEGYNFKETLAPHNLATEQVLKKESNFENNNDIKLVKHNIGKQRHDVLDDVQEKADKTKYIWWKYFRVGGSTFILLCVATTLILAQVLVSSCDYWVAHWIKQEESKGNEFVTDNVIISHKYALFVFAILLFASVAMWTASNLLFYKVCMNASKNLHSQMLSCLLKAPAQFFYSNSTGKILNRFTKDTGLVDETLPTVTLDAVHVILMVSGVIVQVLIVNWWALFPITVVGVICWKFKNIYLPTAQNIRRLESEAKSPIFSHVNSTISGLTTIRSAKMMKKAKMEFDSLQNIHTSVRYINIVSASAFGFWLDIVSISLLAFVIFCFTLVKNDEIFAGIVGLAITQILTLYGTVQYGLRQTTEMMTQMISVERIIEFSNLEQEDPFDTNVKTTLENWPEKGQIELKNVSLRYCKDIEMVLKNISVFINPQEKIGIVGRTGAGKTSLISAMFRLVDFEGSIYIDDVDIKTCGLRNLRSKISVIPQNPILFTASVRYNIDPLQKYDSKAIWQALKDVGLNNRFTSLDCCIENGGNNFSIGEKQLFCLARAIVTNNKILILDEATANIDSYTDKIIQQVIQKKFFNCTILTIAHRLNTILDSDKIIVLNSGRVVEFDSPSNLVKMQNGSFFNLTNL